MTGMLSVPARASEPAWMASRDIDRLEMLQSLVQVLLGRFMLTTAGTRQASNHKQVSFLLSGAMTADPAIISRFVLGLGFSGYLNLRKSQVGSRNRPCY